MGMHSALARDAADMAESDGSGTGEAGIHRSSSPSPGSSHLAPPPARVSLHHRQGGGTSWSDAGTSSALGFYRDRPPPEPEGSADVLATALSPPPLASSRSVRGREGRPASGAPERGGTAGYGAGRVVVSMVERVSGSESGEGGQEDQAAHGDDLPPMVPLIGSTLFHSGLSLERPFSYSDGDSDLFALEGAVPRGE